MRLHGTTAAGVLVVITLLFFVPFAENAEGGEKIDNNSTIDNSTTKVLERSRRDYDHGDYHVKCKSSNTGLFSFFAIPILLGDITIDFMSMIDVVVNVNINNTGTTINNTNNNNNNNNNNNGGTSTTSTSTGTGNNNNNNNNNGRKRRDVNYIEGGANDLFGLEKEMKKSEGPLDAANSHVKAYLDQLGRFSKLSLPNTETKDQQLTMTETRGNSVPSNGDQAAVQVDLADDFVRSMLGAFRKVRKWCKSSKEGRKEECENVEFDREELKKKLLIEISNFNV